MASQLKHTIAKTFYNIWHSKINVGSYNEFFKCMNLRQSEPGKVIWRVELPINKDTSFDDVLLKDTREELLENSAVKSVTQDETYENLMYVEVKEKDFVKDVLDSEPTSLNYKKDPRKVIVEFSSPNIAKPFHVGHLRSTIIGNCLANIKKKLGDDVIKMNYLGDWGTQLGLLQVGLQLQECSEEDFKDDPLKVLLSAYVRGNREAEENLEVYEQAKKVFFNLEFGDEEAIRSWNKYREWTLKGLHSTYGRLGVLFDHFEWESDYNRKEADKVLQILEKNGMLLEDDLGRKVAEIRGKNLPLIKSDNTTLYLMRDLTAIYARRSKYQFDEMYYVVDNGQSEHFTALKALSSQLKLDENTIIEHVKFGRIQRMSTRKGRATPLSVVLNEARDRIYKKQITSENTKVSLENNEVADILGVSSIIVNDLRKRRAKDYEFSWDEAVDVNSSSGIQLQYTHCRLHNLLNASNDVARECDPDALLEPEVLNLALALARYEERVLESNRKLEPCCLTTYLFELAKAINLAYLRLRVKRADAHTAEQRNLMFRKSKTVLNEGMRLLGLKPLDQM